GWNTSRLNHALGRPRKGNDETIPDGARAARGRRAHARDRTGRGHGRRERTLEHERSVHERRRQLADDGRRLSGTGAARWARVPVAGTCRPGPFNSNHSESWLAVKPGTEDLVGTSKFFFDKFSTFYMFYLGAYQIAGGTPTGNNQVQGYDCVTTGTQDMPPS